MNRIAISFLALENWYLALESCAAHFFNFSLILVCCIFEFDLLIYFINNFIFSLCEIFISTFVDVLYIIRNSSMFGVFFLSTIYIIYNFIRLDLFYYFTLKEIIYVKNSVWYLIFFAIIIAMCYYLFWCIYLFAQIDDILHY